MRISGKGITVWALIVLGMFSSAAAGALDVAESEILSEEIRPVEFENYTGPHEIINTVEEIVGIGRRLAAGRYGIKYRIIRAVDPEAEEGLDADILVIDESARVDHIRNVRRILSGYLQESYDYGPSDAMVLAEFITYYNAIHRADMEYIGGKYTQLVVSSLVPEKAGIARSYRDWPGKTMILIPLTERAAEGGLGSLDSEELSTEEVIEEIREQEDRGVEERKEMVELREREIEEERQALEEERRRLEEAEEEAEAEEAEEEEEAESDEDVTDEEAAEEPEDEAEEETEEDREEAEERIAAREQELEEREERVREERERIARDEQELIEEREPVEERAAEEGLLFPRVRTERGRVVSRLISLDTETGTILGRSEADTVIGREYRSYGENFLVLAGPISAGGTVTLLLMNGEDLSTVAESDRVVYVNSYVETNGRDIFAVVEEDGEWYIGKYDSRLSLVFKSDRPVTMDTVIMTQGNLVYAQAADGTILSFTAADLTSDE
ncbi:MAG: P83/100 family protein [Spirochaetia bacterium]